MSYEKTIWVKNDIVTAEKLNKIEDQLENNTENITDIEDRIYIIEEHHLDIINGDVEFNKYINEISIDSTDKHKIIISKATLPQRFSGNYDDLTNKPVIPAKTSDLVNDRDFATMSDVPVKVSDLENDAEFITLANIPTDLSSFNDDVGFALEEDIPINVSELINDAEFITAEDIPYIPVKISDLTNDTGFITNNVNDLVNYKSTEDLNVLLEDKVDKVAGYGLTQNDYDDSEKNKVQEAYTHSQETHSPVNAQKNSDITKDEIEEKLTGEITSHSHALPTHDHSDIYYTETEVDDKLDNKVDKVTGKGLSTEDYTTTEKINYLV